jgi:diadenylate cyclase
VIQTAEMVLRIGEEVDGYLVELGEDGRLVSLQSSELSDGVARALDLVIRDYAVMTRDEAADRSAFEEWGVPQLADLTSDELRNPARVASILRLPGAFHDTDSGLEPRGYRLLHHLPRLSDVIIERIVERFENLQHIMRASIAELEQVEGVGQARATSVKEGLARLAEASIFERYQ